MAKKTRTFAWSPLRTLMKNCGAEIVAREAVEELLDYLEKRAKNVTNTALTFTRHANRKKVTKSDIALALDLV